MKIVACLLFLLIAASLLSVQAQTATSSHEEVVVRETYNRTALAAQIGVLVHAALLHSDGWPSISDEPALKKALANQLTFELGDFQVGQLEDVLGVKWTSLVTAFPNANLEVISETLPFKMNSPHSTAVSDVVYADVGWKNAPETRGDNHESVPTVQQALEGIRKGKQIYWSRYASFSVKASLQGQSISYQALFLFGKDKKGTDTVLPIDYATPGIAAFVGQRMYPTALLETVVREIPIVSAWIASHQLSGCKKTRYPEVCCDDHTGRCGIASEDARASLSVPVDPDTRWFIKKRGEDK